MPLSIETMLLERVIIGVSLMIAFLVNVFKSIGVQFLLFHLQSGLISFEVCLIAPGELSMMFTFMWTIVLNILQSLSPTGESSMFLFLEIFALEDFKIQICFLNSYNMTFYIEASVDQILSLIFTLGIPNIHSNNCHVKLR